MAASTTSKQFPADMRHAARSESQRGSQHMKPAQDLMDYYRQYARERPEAFALWCLGIGFVLGWKLKPW